MVIRIKLNIKQPTDFGKTIEESSCSTCVSEIWFLNWMWFPIYLWILKYIQHKTTQQFGNFI